MMEKDIKRIWQAVTFAERFDDGRDLQGLPEADIVLIGVSRTSKTPVSMYLAFQGIKAANIPLVPGIELPPVIFEIPAGKVVGLTMSPQRLADLRRIRLGGKGSGSASGYVDINQIIMELDYADRIFRRLGCPVIDVTSRAVEEVAGLILEIHKKKRDIRRQSMIASEHQIK